MTKELFVKALTRFLAGVLLVGTLVFLPAGTVNFFGGWLLMGVLFVPMTLLGVVLTQLGDTLLTIATQKSICGGNPK